MPTDKSGRFHGNIQRAMAADKASAPAPKPKAPRAAAPAMEQDGDEGPVSHLKAFHGAMGGGKLHVVHHDGINVTSHKIGEDGQVEGPTEHDPENLDELKAAMDQFFTEEGADHPSAELSMARGDIKDVY